MIKEVFTLEGWNLNEFNRVTANLTRDQMVYLLTPLVGGMVALYIFLLVIAKKRSVVFTPAMFWFIMCIPTHSFVELLFVIDRDSSAAGDALDLYGSADLRYGRPLEHGTAAMELITATFTSFFCLLSAIGIARNASWRHVAIIIASTCQV